MNWLQQRAHSSGAARKEAGRAGSLQDLVERFRPAVLETCCGDSAEPQPHAQSASDVREQVLRLLDSEGIHLTLIEQRRLVRLLLDEVLSRMAPLVPCAPAKADPTPEPGGSSNIVPRQDRKPSSFEDGTARSDAGESNISHARLEAAKRNLQDELIARIDTSAAGEMSREDLRSEVADLVAELVAEHKTQLNKAERGRLVDMFLDDMLGLGPLEPLLADEDVTDIMVNGPRQVYIEKFGKLVLSDVRFRDNRHVMSVAQRIVTGVGRRVDESVPLVDARLGDGSRVNIIIPPLAIDGPSISIRKFAKKKITLDVMQNQSNLSAAMATLLRIAGRCRINILISGGTGSGKTTLLNAISQMIDPAERIVTIEDAAELQLQQPHVVRLETRPANIEGSGEITMRDLVKNALRMRPDRIILGECRGSEALDMLQAMNTGHDGSLSTIHANRPREALTRLENMVGMAGVNLPAKAVRTQIASAIHMIIQVSRMRDGKRRITHISEIVGMEGDVITMQDLFWYDYMGEDGNGQLLGEFVSASIRPHFTPRAQYYGLDRTLLECL